MKNKQINYHDRVISIPGVVGGKPVIKGTRIPVALILERLEEDTDTKGPSGNKLTREGAISDTGGYEDDIKRRKVRPDAQEPE